MFSVQPDLRGRQNVARIEYLRARSGPFSGLRVVRKRSDAPQTATSGLVIFDLVRQIGLAESPGQYCRRFRGLTSNSGVDGGLAEFDLWEVHPTPPDNNSNNSHPSCVHLDYWDGTALKSYVFPHVTNAGYSTTYEQLDKPYTVKHTHYYDGDTLLFETHVWSAEGEPFRLDLKLPNQSLLSIFYDVHELWESNLEASDDHASFTWTRDGATLLTGEATFSDFDDGVTSRWFFELRDAVPSQPAAPAGLDAPYYYYYSLFIDESPGNPSQCPAYLGKPASAVALATGLFGEGDRLYQSIPAIHRTYDEPDPEVQGQGQLRRFLSVFGSALDQLRGLAEGLSHRHNILTATPGTLGHLARGIAFDVDLTTSGEVQRNDVLFAASLFERVGTLPCLRAMIRRVTDVPFVLHEHTHNVCYTNARPTYWDIWKASSSDGMTFGQASPTRDNLSPERLAGRPAAVLGEFGCVWLFWHEYSNGQRQLWVSWPNEGYQPVRLAQFDYLEDPLDECPAAVLEPAGVRLFWSSRRTGDWRIWTRLLPKSYAGGQLSVGAAMPVTGPEAETCNPAAIVAGDGRLWLFWQSRRRGPTDIWAQVRGNDGWSAPVRVTTAEIADATPTAALDANGNVHLFWSSVTPNGCRLFESVLADNAWSEPEPVTALFDASGAMFRDEAPCAVLFQGELRLFWHSNRAGAWQIWSCAHNDGAWHPPFKVEQQIANGQVNTHMVAAKEPAVIVENNSLLGYWRAQRRVAGVSRTFNTADVNATAALGSSLDWSHYTYDSRRDLSSRHANETVGVYFFVEEGPTNEMIRMIRRVQAFVEPYRPATVRLVYFAGKYPVADDDECLPEAQQVNQQKL